MSYTFKNSTTELFRWIRDEVEFDKEIKKSTRNGGQAVERIQEWLVFHGFLLGIDGGFGPVTETMVKRFQGANGFAQSGVVNKPTFDALVAPMRSVLQRASSHGLSYNDALEVHAQAHLSMHPIEVGSENNSGMWVRLYMKGNQGRFQLWCAGFVSFILYQAAESSGVDRPLDRHISVDLLAVDGQRKGIFVAEADVDKSKIKPGSIFLLRRSQGDWFHTGYVTAVHDTMYETIEGNANQQRSPNGYEVCSVSRGYKDTDFIVFDSPRTHKSLAEISEVRRYFYDGPSSYTYGSFFSHWGGWVTAKHVIDEMSGNVPNFASGLLISGPGGLDGSTIGCVLPNSAPSQLTEGQAIVVHGYPAGSSAMEERIGEVYLKRPQSNAAGVIVQGPSWIVRIDTPHEPVVTGMSGGVARDGTTGEPVGIIIATNSPWNIDSDPEPDHSLDIVSLHDLWHAIRSMNVG